jgi:UDP-glucuronate 4-epimerase
VKKILVSGVAGFIGFHLVKKLVKNEYDVVGVDNINDYYDVNLKYGRLNKLGIDKTKIEYNKIIESDRLDNFRFIKVNIEDKDSLFGIFRNEKFDNVCHLAAQAGVRYSLENPYAYIDSNIYGFMNVLEGCRQFETKNLSFASSSSVYGINKKQPFSEHDCVDHPISLYAATKKSNEMMAHTYSYLFGLNVTGLRFFTVYGPWGRPDMALFMFVKNILENKPIDVYNHGNMQRDFTYIDDIVEGVFRTIQKPAEPNQDFDFNNPDPSSSVSAYKIYNIGNNAPVKLMDFISAIEEILGKKAIMRMLPLQPGDVKSTFADVGDLIETFNYKPKTPIKEGVNKFIAWFREFYHI